MIERVDDEQRAVVVDRQAVRGVELARLRSFFSKADAVFAFCRELLDAAADRVGPQPTFGVEANSGRPAHCALAERGKLVTELARPSSTIAPGEERFSGGAELLHAAKDRFGRKDIAVFIAGQKGGTGKECLRVRIAAELAALEAFAAPLAQKLSLRVEDLNPPIALIGHVDATFADRDSAGHVELPFARAELTPFAEQFPCG